MKSLQMGLILLLFTQTVFAEDSVPADLVMTRFSGSDITPCPACLCVSAKGEVYAGVDPLGSLGKGPGKGSIVKLIDEDKDGVADSHTVYAKIDHPRGLISISDKVYVLHTVYGKNGIAEGMNLSVLEDKDRDGVADGPEKTLIKGICQGKSIRKRGTDHSTNGIRMGIDGWIYIAIGDFGFDKAVGTDGTTLNLLGGGIVRVRPDGTEMELYTTGLRNIYDVAIDPFMNVYTRGNTNDGGGWNMRFIHQIQSGHYGYPHLFKNFADEIIPALEDLGGGSGAGALFLDEPTWPAEYNKQPLMADWGRKKVFLHRLKEDGPSFTQLEEEMMTVSQVTDLDVDPSGQLFLSAWDGAGFRGKEGVGYLIRVTPKSWKHESVSDFEKASTSELLRLLVSSSATTRFYAQQALLESADRKLPRKLKSLIRDNDLSLEARVAALYTYAQLKVTPRSIVAFAEDDALREFAIRASTDRLPRLESAALSIALYVAALEKGTPRERAAAAIALGRLGNSKASDSLIAVPFVKPESARKIDGKPRHSTPNPDIIVPHLAVKSLVYLHAVKSCLKAIGTSSQDLALWALSYMHDEQAVDGLLAKLEASKDATQQHKLMTVLARLYQKEAPYDGSWWWGTRPNTRGPYYKPVTWSASFRIAKALEDKFDSGDEGMKASLQSLNLTHRLNITKLMTQGGEEAINAGSFVDLAKIALEKGAIAKMPIEDIILSLDDFHGNTKKGKTLFTKQGCIACHALKAGGPSLGPFMGQIGSIMDRAQIATAILRPNDTISQGFQSVQITMKDGSMHLGFITESNSDRVILRSMTGQATTLARKHITEEKHLPNSMMPPGLANSLSMRDFASLVAFLESQK